MKTIVNDRRDKRLNECAKLCADGNATARKQGNTFIEIETTTKPIKRTMLEFTSTKHRDVIYSLCFGS